MSNSLQAHINYLSQLIEETSRARQDAIAAILERQALVRQYDNTISVLNIVLQDAVAAAELIEGEKVEVVGEFVSEQHQKHGELPFPTVTSGPPDFYEKCKPGQLKIWTEPMIKLIEEGFTTEGAARRLGIPVSTARAATKEYRDARAQQRKQAAQKA